MIEGVVANHPQRIPLTNELHARPFAPMVAPGRLVTVAFQMPDGAAERDPAIDRAHLYKLIDRHAGAHPAPDANHYFGDFGRFRLKWERHTEFVTYTLYEQGEVRSLFTADLAAQFPRDWLADAPGQVIAAAQIEVLWAPDAAAGEALLNDGLLKNFALESLACSRVLDGNAIAIGDFRIHEGGFSRFALIVHGAVGPRRVGRMTQRLIEIETYRTIAMLTLPIARTTALRLNEIDRELSGLIAEVATNTGAKADATILSHLTALSAEIEALSAAASFRFGAGTAYEALVQQRIEGIREERMGGRQTFAEFMVRRFDPAMRTCHAAERRLSDLSTRASRIADLLRTRVNVTVEAQNQDLLASMNRRAALQLRLQRTVEGLSVVAISYYALSLVAYGLEPVAHALMVEKSLLTALAVGPVVLVVWLLLRRTRKHLERGPD